MYKIVGMICIKCGVDEIIIIITKLLLNAKCSILRVNKYYN